ncbi:hypothetical protein T02_15471 [Trichinella nativa]|uniref:Uncharacterized protein n=1 Tax=Trichinella nativa TaxID=6335 RepID=A0A0V1L654_9BILA|nr:hypothetical protein T09_7995 [Trichinella sp. T9]KRX71035.1 hypothetical protein T06_2262 [Trichinella sp. T6]KRZ54961.1 hypothetical protein T02_15471 [Trichinella nativa]KRZ84497.1 hypothetical protein T08_13808 [Trichinella sp. T8]
MSRPSLFTTATRGGFSPWTIVDMHLHWVCEKFKVDTPCSVYNAGKYDPVPVQQWLPISMTKSDKFDKARHDPILQRQNQSSLMNRNLKIRLRKLQAVPVSPVEQ